MQESDELTVIQKLETTAENATANQGSAYTLILYAYLLRQTRITRQALLNQKNRVDDLEARIVDLETP